MTQHPDTHLKLVSPTGLMSLRQVAAWQMPELRAECDREIIPTLPSLQRSPVWKAKQVEELWDSISRGFPIGAILLSKFDINLGIQPGLYEQQMAAQPTHHILDGQQRATAITVGFQEPSDLAKEALWVDLENDVTTRDVRFLFRFVSRSHPWGYSRSDPDEILRTFEIRNALSCYRMISPKFDLVKPHKIPLSAVWPWDTKAPIPVYNLIKALTESNNNDKARGLLLDSIKKLPFFTELALPAGRAFTKNEKVALDKHQKQRRRVYNAISSPKSKSYQCLEALMNSIRDAIETGGRYRIPILMIDLKSAASEGINPSPINEKQSSSDVIVTGSAETLFVRINRSGTPLEGEELIYSLLKSSWIEAPVFIKKISRQMATPARVVFLCARLAQARQINQAHKYPPTLRVSDFQRLMREDDTPGLVGQQNSFGVNLRRLIEDDKKGAEKIFEICNKLLIYTNDATFALPPVLATELAHKAPNVFFLLLRWIDRMLELEIDPLRLAPDQKKKLIGFITAIAWFAPNERKAVEATWDNLQRADATNLPNFFENRIFRCSLELTGDKGAFAMIPLPTPDAFRETLIELVVKRMPNNIYGTRGDSTIWDDAKESGGWEWRWLVSSPPKEIKKCFSQSVRWLWHNRHNHDDLNAIYREAWHVFLDTASKSRSLLLYAQRHSLKTWFDDFDPSLPENLVDKNRPWDFDHIHPQSHLRTKEGSIIRRIMVIRYWHATIGNLRAWPLELNRSDRASTPNQKIRGPLRTHEQLYGIVGSSDSQRICARMGASFISKDDWKLWVKSAPSDEQFPLNYLSKDEYIEQRTALVSAIIIRLANIYSEWYKSLLIDKLNTPDA